MPSNKTKFSKTDVRFWFDRLFKRAAGSDWHVQIAFASHQEKFPLKTPNKEAAAAKARDIYLSLHSSGWEATRRTHKPWTNKTVKIASPTIGEFISTIEKYGGIDPATLKIYAGKFRRLASEIQEIPADKSRFNRGAGNAAWRKKVDAIRLADLKPAEINRWRLEHVARRRNNPIMSRRAETTAHSVLRNARCLFSKRIAKRLASANVELQLQDPLPFDGVEIGVQMNHRYTSAIDMEKLARDSSKELAASEPELFKIFLLAFGVGLRRGEIDRLAWAQFNWHKDQINVEATAHGDVKTDSSLAAVDVDPALMKIFKKFKDKAAGEFVVESSVKPRPGANWYHYRCACAFKRINTWLRGKGVDTPNPIHTLRKEFGTAICEKFGIFAASEALRHSDIRLTRAHYVDRRGRIHLEVGKMLTGK